MNVSVQDRLRAMTAYLQAAEIEIPHASREARILMAKAMGVSADRMTLMAHDPIENRLWDNAMAMATRRTCGEPMSHIIGQRQFYGRDFHVDARVLDPRPETEMLIEAALAEPFDAVLDLGTGSGAIVATLLAERPDARGVGADVSQDALDVAAQNAALLGVENRLQLVKSDWFANVTGVFDLIVSNPPYIAAGEMDGLQREVRVYEPRMALTDEGDGLSCYRQIISGYAPHLSPQGRLIVEIGPTQAGAVCEMMAQAGLMQITVIRDLDGRDRTISAHNP